MLRKLFKWVSTTTFASEMGFGWERCLEGGHHRAC